MVILINVVVDADKVITEVARIHVEDSDKAPTGAVGEDNSITPLLEIGILAITEDEGTLQAAAREFAASTVTKWVTLRRTAGPPCGKHLPVAVADKLDATRMECLLSTTRWPNANKKKRARLLARLATRRTKSTRSPLVVTGLRRIIECASCAKCLVNSMGLYTQLLVDSGSPVTIIRYDFKKQVRDPTGAVEEEPEDFQGVTQDGLRVVGLTRLNLSG